MSDNGHQEFIEHACESFKEDDELALLAKDQISTMVHQSEVDLSEANKNLTTGFFSQKKNRVAIVIAMLIIGIGIVFYQSRQVGKLGNLSPADFFYAAEYESPVDQYSHLNEDEKLILFGDPEAQTALEIAESRWKHQPGNPLYYTEYVRAYYQEYENFPEDMITKGDQIDPSNSLYRLCVVAKSVRDKVVKNKKNIDLYAHETKEERLARRSKKSAERREARRKNRERIASKKAEPETTSPQVSKPKTTIKKSKLKELVIMDQEKFQTALKLVFEAAEKEVCSEHTADLMKERVPLLNSKRQTLAGHLAPFTYLAQVHTLMFNVTSSQDIIVAEAQRCGRDKDGKALQRLVLAHERIAKQLMKSENVTLLDALVARAFIMGVQPHFRDAARDCDLPEVEKKYADLYVSFEKDKAAGLAALGSGRDPDLQKYGSIITLITTPMLTSKIRDQSVVSPVDHEPLRCVEHSLFSRTAIVVLWLILVLLAGVFCIANKYKSKLTKHISQSLLGVLGKKDWLLVALLGVIAPLVSFYLLDRYSPWKITSYNLAYASFIHSVARVVVLFLILLCCQVIVLEWRIARVTGRIFGRQRIWLIWLSLVLAILPILMIKQIADANDPMKWYVAVVISLFLLITFTFLRFLPGLFSYKNSILSRALVLSLMMTSMALTLLLPFYATEERRWITKDEVMKLSPDRASFSKLEGEVTRQFVRETRELMGWSEVE